MKLKSLFLATLAAMAMASCSNENDPIVDNGNQAEKTALLNLGFAFPKAPATKATEAGIQAEYEFSKVAIIIDYKAQGEKNAERLVKMLNRTEFSPTATPSQEDNSVVIYTKQAIPVNDGDATIYAIVNPTNTEADLKTIDLKSMKLNPEYTTLGALQVENGPAADENFMMTSATDGIEKTFVAKQTTAVRIPVVRVVAKLVEATGSAEFTLTNEGKKIATGLTESTNEIKNIKLTRATYVNLATASNVFEQNVDPKNWLQKYTRTSTTLPNPNADNGFEYITLGKTADVKYCFENSAIQPTAIIYEATVTWDDEATPSDFYIAAGKLYKTYEELQADFPESICPDEGASPQEFAAQHIRKYVGGKCYYYHEIKTRDASTIKRNNVYKLTATGIAKIGSSTTTIEEDETLMNVSIEVQPWTVNENAFVLQ